MFNNKKILSVITARAGSKGIPQKNIRWLMGKPLFEWSVLASLNSKYIDKTVVSSNCPEIERICKKNIHQYNYGKLDIEKVQWSKVEFIKRPEDISGDLSKNEEALIHSYNYLKEDYDFLINLQPTSPIRLSGLLDRSIKYCIEGGYDSLLSGMKLTPFMWRKMHGKWYYIVDNNGCCNRKMRQQFKDGYNSEFILHDTGNIFLTNTNILLETNCRIGKTPCVFEIDKLNSLQIDEEFDFELIENMVKSRNLDSLI